MPVEFWEQRLFKEIAATRSMSRGAEHCGVSQSAASQHVQEVERRLGVILLDRSKRPLELTLAGKIYSDFCRDVLRREEEFSHSLESLKGDVEGTVRVASIYSAGLSEMSRLGEQFAEKYPTAQLQVQYMRPDKIYESLREDAADLGLVSYPESSREIAAIPWREEEMHVAVPPNHPLAERTEVYPADLNGHAFIGFDEDLRIRRELDRFLRAGGGGQPGDALRQHSDDQGSCSVGAGNQHPAGAHYAGRDRTRTPGGGEAECARIGAAIGDRAPAKEEIQSGYGGVAGHVDGLACVAGGCTLTEETMIRSRAGPFCPS
jgi:DNA-binding transcriptional LysR family regulator